MSRRSGGRPWVDAAWIVVAGMALTALSPLVRRHRWRAITITQSLLPWALAPAPPIAVAGLLTRRRGLAASGTALAATAVAVSAPLLRRRSPTPTGSRLAVGHANLLYANIRIGDAAALLAHPGLDVITFSEYTPQHAAVLRASPSAERFPHRIEWPAALASGTAMWSRYPLVERAGPAVTHEIVVADVDAPTPVRVVAIHTQSPIAHFDGWRHDLGLLRMAPDPAGPPSVMLGDFNAAWWHPELRDVLACGWRDAHQLVGDGLSASWPVGRRRIPFVRLDHALVDDRLHVASVADLPIAGSDHRGIVVEVVVAT